MDYNAFQIGNNTVILSDILFADDLVMRATHKIRHVVNLADGEPVERPEELLSYLNIDTVDDQSSDSDALQAEMPRILSYMHRILTETTDTLLIHCHAGVSRSPTVVACYLMTHVPAFHGNLLGALKQVKAWRLEAFMHGLTFWSVLRAVEGESEGEEEAS